MSAVENAEPVLLQPSPGRDRDPKSGSLPSLPSHSPPGKTVSSLNITPFSTDDDILPAAKRRKLQSPLPETPSVSTSAQTVKIAPTTSTETDQVIPEATGSFEASSPTMWPAVAQDAADITTGSLSATAIGKQRAEIVPDGTVADGKSKPPAQRKKGDQAPKKPRKPSTKQVERQGRRRVEDAAAEVVADAIGASSRQNSKRGRRQREPTPEGAEDVRIVASEVKMSDLCRNVRTGKKSTRELELEKLEEETIRKKKQQQLNELIGDGTPETPESADQRLERLAREKGQREEDVSRAVPNTIIVDGQIQIDESTLQIDRHANAAVERDAEQLEGVDESELTRRVTQFTWGKRDQSGSWDEESTDKFYEGLRMFGTDFQMISKMLPGRTRHSVKLKFRKEERVDEPRIRRALLGDRIPVDMEEYSRVSNTVYADPRELEQELEDEKERMKQEQERAKEALEEIRREREAEANAEGAAVADESSSKENRVGAPDGANAKAKGKRERPGATKKPNRSKK